MPVFPRATADAVIKAMETLLNRLYPLIQHHKFTHAEFEQLFIKPEHYVLNKQLRDIGVCSKGAKEISLPNFVDRIPGRLPTWVSMATAKILFCGHYDGILPAYIQDGYLVTKKNASLIETANDQFVYNTTMHVEAAMAKTVLAHLLETCGTPQQVMFYLPSLTAVMRVGKDMEKLADSIDKRGTPGYLPSVSLELRSDCALANRVISKALMMEPVEPQDYTKKDVLIMPERIIYKRDWIMYPATVYL